MLYVGANFICSLNPFTATRIYICAMKSRQFATQEEEGGVCLILLSITAINIYQ